MLRNWYFPQESQNFKFSCEGLINPLLNDKILDLSKFKLFCRQQIKGDSSDKFVFWIRQKHCEKRSKMLAKSIFFLKHNVFKRLFLQVVKILDCVE